MAKLKCVIFDWAGTTVDFGSMSPVEAFRVAFKEKGLEVFDDEIRAPMGLLKRDHIKTMLNMPRIASLFKAKFGHEATSQNIDEIYEVFEPSLMKVLKDCSLLKPYVKEAISYLKDQGIVIGSTTGYTSSMMQTVTACAKEQGYEPDSMVTPDEVQGRGRPYPYMIFENLKRLGVSSVKECIKIGDTFSDIDEGKNAGLFTVGVTEGSSVMGLSQAQFDALSDKEKEDRHLKAAMAFYDHKADFVIRNLSEINLVQRVFENRV